MRIAIEGRPFAYDDTGRDGVPLVLIHGFGAERSGWDPVMEGLGGMRVIRPDLRGSGETPPGDGPALMEVLAGDVAAMLDALGVERAVLAGHSMGGYVALAFFRMYAERVAGLGFVASHALGDTPETAAWREGLAARAERDGTMDAVVAAYIPRMFATHVYSTRPDLVEIARTAMAAQDPLGAAQLLRGIKERVSSEDLYEDLDVPVTVLSGAEDRIVLPAWSRRIADGVRGATSAVVEGAGHMLPLEAADRTAHALRELAGRATAARLT